MSYNPKKDKQRQRFFDLALSMKNTLEPDHPSKKILVSKLFEEAQDAGIRENEWKIWLNEKLE